MAPIEYRRQFPPQHFSLRIDSFSKLAEACEDGNGKYDSIVFKAQGLSWKLVLYPNGNTKRYGEGHISLYLALDRLPSNRDVHVEFKFFVYDRPRNEYLVIYDEAVKRFDKKQIARGYDKLLPLSKFKDAGNGYLVTDQCEFGVELFVVDFAIQRQQTFKMIERSSPFRRTFKDFSNMKKDPYITPITHGGKTWNLKLYPKGKGTEMGNSLSIFLELVDEANLQPGFQVWAHCIIRVIDQHRDNHKYKTFRHWFSSSNPQSWGFIKFMPLGDLSESKKGFVVNDKLIVEVEFINVSVTKA